MRQRTQQLTLYSFPRTRSARCLWALQELGLAFETITVDLPHGEHRSPEFLAINPFGKVPALADGDLVLFESVAICQYLAQRYGDGALLPPVATAERALHDQWLLFCVTELEQPLWRMRRHRLLYPEQLRLPAEIDLARDDFSRAAAVLEEAVGSRSYLAGDSLTVADIVTGYTLRWATWEALLDRFDALQAYLDRLRQRPAFPDELRSP